MRDDVAMVADVGRVLFVVVCMVCGHMCKWSVNVVKISMEETKEGDVPYHRDALRARQTASRHHAQGDRCDGDLIDI